jgi:hypothetical protein
MKQSVYSTDFLYKGYGSAVRRLECRSRKGICFQNKRVQYQGLYIDAVTGLLATIQVLLLTENSDSETALPPFSDKSLLSTTQSIELVRGVVHSKD